MTLCQLIKKVLDEQHAEVPDKNRDQAIKQQLELLSKWYANLKSTKCPGVDYGSPASRFAYIRRYTVAHADYVSQVIQDSPALTEVFGKDDIQAACLGGGPGSDFLGMLKYMNAHGKKSSLTCYLFDRERAWADSWGDVARLLETEFRFYPSFCHMDATDPETYKMYGRFLKADVFTLIYFMSELRTRRRKAEPFFDHCFAGAKEGALVVYIDNRDPEFRGWFDSLAKRNGIKLLEQRSCEMVFEGAEQNTDLGEYFGKFGWLKRKGKVDIRVGRKA